jgi:hypothetical protein
MNHLDLDSIAQQDEETTSSAINVVTPMAVDDSENQANFGLSSPLPVSESSSKSFVQAMKAHMAWTPHKKDGRADESPLHVMLKEGIKKTGIGFLKDPSDRALTESDKNKILLCKIAFSGLTTYKLGMSDLIGSAFNVGEARVSQIAKVGLEPLLGPSLQTPHSSTQTDNVEAPVFQTNSSTQTDNVEAPVLNPANASLFNAVLLNRLPATQVPTITSDQDLAQHPSRAHQIPPNQPAVIEVDDDSRLAERIIAEGVSVFHQTFSKPGTRPKEIEAAVQAVDAAAFSHVKTDEERRAVCRFLGLRPNRIHKILLSARGVIDNAFFSVRKRKTRKDCSLRETKVAIYRFCHDDAYTRIDSNAGRRVPVKFVPGLAEGSKQKHTQRVWTCGSTQALRHKEFLLSPHYGWFKTKCPDSSIGLTRFRENCCNCCRPPSESSCVDELYTSIEWHCADFYKHFVKNADIQAYEVVCECPFHSSIWFARLGQGLAEDLPDDEVRPAPHPEPALAFRPTKFLEMTCCPKNPEPDLKHTKQNLEEEIPMLIPYSCVFPTGDDPVCLNCGPLESKFSFFDCPMLRTSDIRVDSTQWREVARRSSGTKQRTQKEETLLIDEPLKDVLADFKSTVESAREHYFRAQWCDTMRKIDTLTLDEFGARMHYDFSAGPDLKSSKLLNSSENNHCVYELYLVMYNPRIVQILDPSITTPVSRMICDCEAFHCVGEAQSRGKKNDAAFHEPVAKKVLDIIAIRIRDITKEKLAALEEELEGREPLEADTKRLADLRRRASYDPADPSAQFPFDSVIEWSDNCCAQYKNRKNFLVTAKHSDTYPGGNRPHRYAEKEQFKTEVDSEGKVGKQNVKLNAHNGIFSPNGHGMIVTISGPHGIGKLHIDHKKLEEEGSPKLLDRGMTTITGRSFIYATEDADLYEQIKDNREYHVILLDRNALKDMRVLDQSRSSTLHEVIPGGSHGDNTYKLLSNLLPCSCVNCRGNHAEHCKFKEQKQTLEHIVRSLEDEPDETRMVSDEELILKSIYPDEKITVNFLNILLEKMHLPKTGIREAKILRVVERMVGHDEEDSPEEGMYDDIVDITPSSDDDSDAESMDGSGSSHLDDSSLIVVEGLDFEYPSSDESDDESLNGSESPGTGNDDSYKELAPIEQEGQETTTEETSSEDRNFDNMTVMQLRSHCK